MKSIIKSLSLLIILAISFTSCKDDDPKPFKQNVALQMNHMWQDSTLVLNTPYLLDYNLRTDTITPTKLIYHINHLTLLTEDSARIDANHEYYMYNSEDAAFLPEPISFTTPLEGVKYYVSAIEFTIGVADSTTSAVNMLSSKFLSPMYWGMIAGYINFKFEAMAPNVQVMIYHIGGYLKPYANSRRIRIGFDKPYLLEENNTLTLSANLYKLFNSKTAIDIETINDIHMPNDNSVIVADNIAELFGFVSLK